MEIIEGFVENRLEQRFLKFKNSSSKLIEGELRGYLEGIYQCGGISPNEYFNILDKINDVIQKRKNG